MKLTLISISFKGRNHSRFISCQVVDGKTIAPQSVLQEMLDHVGVRRGDTYTFA